jgi:CubicO group peptidase (beta-lactamase class C family)
MKFNFYFTTLAIIICFTACRQAENRIEKTTAIAPAETTSIIHDSIPAATNKTNWLQPPYKHWAIKNVDKLFPIGKIAKAAKPNILEKAPMSFDDLMIEQFDGKLYRFEEHLDSNRTDGFIILHHGKIVYEKYFDNMTEQSSHNWFSVSKSLIGLTVAVLAEEGKIDLQHPVTDYIPELKGSAWDGIPIQQLMDMTVNIKYDEIYLDPRSDAYVFARVTHLVEMPSIPPEFDNVLDYFKSVRPGNNTEELFHYISLNTEVLGMLIKKVTGKQPSEVMSEKIWSHIGAEHDAYVARSPNGYELVSGAINSTLRDAARLGQLMLDNGVCDGKQVVPESVVETIARGGQIEKFAQSKRGQQFKNFHYKNQWWHTDKEAYFAKGLFGQWIYVDPSSETVIVKFTTSDIPTSTEYDWMNNMELMKVITKKLRSNS